MRGGSYGGPGEREGLFVMPIAEMRIGQPSRRRNPPVRQGGIGRVCLVLARAGGGIPYAKDATAIACFGGAAGLAGCPRQPGGWVHNEDECPLL
jgi:hypothetical protein